MDNKKYLTICPTRKLTLNELRIFHWIMTKYEICFLTEDEIEEMAEEDFSEKLPVKYHYVVYKPLTMDTGFVYDALFTLHRLIADFDYSLADEPSKEFDIEFCKRSIKINQKRLSEEEDPVGKLFLHQSISNFKKVLEKYAEEESDKEEDIKQFFK